MADELPLGKAIRIRDCGHDEVWLQDQIVANPQWLGLGDLEFVTRERIQSSGGRLDILLEVPDEAMYEVEVMLGDTDETHIIRAIEYWTRERRKRPLRQHYPVLVAENFDRRFFDVIQAISYAIPLIAIKACVIEVQGNRALTFQTVLNAYEEPEEDVPIEFVPHDESFWLEKAPWTNETAKFILNLVKPTLGPVELNYVKHYISIAQNRNIYFWLRGRATPKSLLCVWVGEQLIGTAAALLDANGIPYRVQNNKELHIPTDKKLVEEKADAYVQLSKLVKQAFED